MAKEGDYTISDIYTGSKSPLTPPNDYITAGSLGMTTDPRTANILQEVSSKLSSGVKQIEIEAVSPDIFDSIPKQQLKEVHRLSKLTGVGVSLHGPVIDVSGIDQRAGGFSELNRESAERKVAEVLFRSQELNPEGNIPVNFHTAEGIGGSQLLPPDERSEKSQYKRLVAVNKESGKMIGLEHEEEYRPGMNLEKPISFTPELRIKNLNETEWDNSLNQTIFQKEQIDKIIQDNIKVFENANKKLNQFLQQGMDEEEALSKLSLAEQSSFSHLANARESLLDLNKNLGGFFDRAYKYGKLEDDKDAKEKLKEISKDYSEILQKNKTIMGQSQAMQFLLNNLKEITPEIYVPIEKFALENSAKTFGNAAWKAYNQLEDKKNAPMLVIENPPAGFALSTGQDVADMVVESRKQFIKNAIENGMPENQAKKEAEKLIGATLDVGHMNMLRKYGYEEKDIIKESEKVAPYIKHVHLSDNFGYEHTELPMGMGNVPLKEIMKKLGKKGIEAKKIIDARHWWQHFRTHPFQETLEAVGSPLYSMKMAQNWSQAPELSQSYFSGYGQILPQGHYESFGAGFSRLPAELGGQTQGGAGSRMSGRPME